MNSRLDDQERQETYPQTARRAIVPAPRVRQSVLGHNVRYVLGFGLAGVIIAFAIVYIIFFGPHLGS